jgi:hypothetical protein
MVFLMPPGRFPSGDALRTERLSQALRISPSLHLLEYCRTDLTVHKVHEDPVLKKHSARIIPWQFFNKQIEKKRIASFKSGSEFKIMNG